MQVNSPLFALTCDVDWASEACIDDVADCAAELEIVPTFMATHESRNLRTRHAAASIELGLHPNFLPGSDHGNTIEEVIEFVTQLYPEAKTFRSHCFFDGSPIQLGMLRRGIRYDSNLSLYLQSDIVPLRHASGLIRLPTFWYDDVHWNNEPTWELTDSLYEKFLTPGLKVIGIHPFAFSLNLASHAEYQARKGELKAITAQQISDSRNGTPGARTFVLELLRRVRAAGHRFYTLSEIHKMYCDSELRSSENIDLTRGELHSQAAYDAYWTMGKTERQEFIRSNYNRRDGTDPYATSRDYNARELEIEAVARYLPKGDIIDLGCGNGYTLASLMRRSPDRKSIGVDFSEQMIEGAKQLSVGLDSPPEFQCADAVDYIKRTASETCDGVITERFLINLPDQPTQHDVLRNIGRVLRPGGRLLMCEGSLDGLRALNQLRARLDLEEIPETSVDNVSSIRFNDAELEAFVRNEVGMRLLGKFGFSTYFAISRALHPKLVTPQSPRFSSKINDIAREVQMALPFSSELGSNALWVFEKP